MTSTIRSGGVDTGDYEAGGFLNPSTLSPVPPTTAESVDRRSLLPKPRCHPLRPGSVKETAVINHIDKAILSINRRHAKKFSRAIEDQDQPQNLPPGATAAGERGYESFKEVAKSIEAVVDILWVTGTPSLQIPYLISLAVMVNSYMPEYPFSPHSTFRLIRKLDSTFSSLLLGKDPETGASLSGFESRRNLVSMTEKVRIKSLTETCRLAVVEAREQQDGPIDEAEEEKGRQSYGNRYGIIDADNDDDDDDDDDDEMEDVFGAEYYNNEGPGKWEMEAARVYEKTIQLLGDELGKQGDLCDISETVHEGDLS